MTEQIKYITNLSNKFGTRLENSRLNECDALLTMNTRVLWALAYPLVTLTLTKNDCSRILTPLLYPVLGRAKIARTIPRAVLYVPLQHQGFGLTNLCVSQGSVQFA